MLKVNRKEKIIEVLQELKETRIDYLSKILDVSIATVHRDVDELSREGRIKKVFGGILLNSPEDTKTKNIIRLNTNVDSKKIIAQKALDFIQDDECIFLDNSSTCYYFACAIAERKYKNLVIVTNSYSIPEIFINNDSCKVVCTGGLFIKDMNCFAGPCSISAINEFNGNKFFFSVSAVSLNGELSDIYDIDLVSIKREMFKRSKMKICIIDSSKFNRDGQSKIFNLNEIDIIVTDNNLNIEKRNELNNAGIKIVL